jgi:hypothetical protein
MIKHSICIALAIASATPASAEKPWPYSEFSAERKGTDHSKKVRTYRKRNRVITRRHKRPEPRVAARNCQPTISVVGDQAQSTKGAQSQAWKAYQGEARFRYGERFADPRHAELIRMECVYSSIKNVANRFTETVGVNTQFERCSVTARPCRAGVK